MITLIFANEIKTDEPTKILYLAAVEILLIDAPMLGFAIIAVRMLLGI